MFRIGIFLNENELKIATTSMAHAYCQTQIFQFYVTQCLSLPSEVGTIFNPIL